MDLGKEIRIFYQQWEDSIDYLITYDEIGSIRLSYNKDVKRATLSDLYVNERFRKQGIGSKLIMTAEQLANEIGLVFIQLECTLKNKELLLWYTEKGYAYSSESSRDNYIYLQKNIIAYQELIEEIKRENYE